MPNSRSLRCALRIAPLVLAAMTLLPAQAQTSSQTGGPPNPADDNTYLATLTFDVASVRESVVVDHALHVAVVNPPHASKFEVTNFTAKSLIQLAYGFGTPISGGPDWLSDRYFTVQAKSDATMDEKLAKLPDDQARLEKQHMLQVLLADRLGLKFHWETRETPVFALLISKGGPKLLEVKASAPDPNADTSFPKPVAPQSTDVKATVGRQGLEFQTSGASSRAIAAMLVSQVNNPVIDRTGLTGTYKFTLQFGRDWSTNNPDSWPDITTAIQEQLGLRLELTKAPIPVFVIDHIASPSAN